VQVKVTGLVNPPLGVTVTVKLADWPAVIVMLPLLLRVKLPMPLVSYSVAVVLEPA
jgi:hypothetical protein